MLHKEESAVRVNSQLNEKLSELKARISNPQAAAEVRDVAKDVTQTRAPFDATTYEEHLKDNLSFSYLHLVSQSDE